MNGEPILVVQTRRLGDLILAFPLINDLRRRFPHNPVRVMAEPAFSRPLAPFAPEVEFIPPALAPGLANLFCRAIINLSSSRMANELTAKVKTGLRLGMSQSAEATRVYGFWQLYLASLTHNNRHNTFHWADLFRMDLGLPLVIPANPIRRKSLGGAVGLFVGASEAAKRPEAPFWIKLIGELKSLNLVPLLLGGPDEKDFGARIARQTNLEKNNFCGKTDLAALADILKNIDLLIAPDTGPTHLADWLGTPVLNLSMGNVQAEDTGPASAGQLVLRSAISCYGCWTCRQPEFLCKRAFNPAKVASVAAKILGAKDENLAPKGGLELFRVARDDLGLRKLVRLAGEPTARDYLDDFWRAAFLFFNDHDPEGQKLALARDALAARFPPIITGLSRQVAKTAKALAPLIRRGEKTPKNFWREFGADYRPFAGFLQMSLQNADFSRDSILQNLGRVETLRELFAATQ